MTTWLPLLSVAAFLCALLLSVWSRANVGLFALAISYALGVLGAQLTVRQVMAGFPVPMFLTIVSLTFLFGHAQENGTLARVAGYAVQWARGRPGVLPPIFFGIAVVLGTMGAGNIGSVALLSPIAMAVAQRTGIPPFLMALLLICGGNAASLSPLSPTGVIAADLLARIGIVDRGLWTYLHVLFAHTFMATGGYLLLGGARLLFSPPNATVRAQLEALLLEQKQPFSREHVITLVVLALMLGSVVFFRVEIGVAALSAGVLLSLLRVSNEEQVLKELPWGTIWMVCGMTCLLTILERTGGLDRFVWAIDRLSTPSRAPLVVGCATGILSAYSSSSGVVLPAFLPLLPKLIQKMGGGDLVALANTVNVSAHLVDVSPLSTLGALCVAQMKNDSGKLYRQLLVFGLSMAVVGAVYCQLVFGFR